MDYMSGKFLFIGKLLLGAYIIFVSHEDFYNWFANYLTTCIDHCDWMVPVGFFAWIIEISRSGAHKYFMNISGLFY